MPYQPANLPSAEYQAKKKKAVQQQPSLLNDINAKLIGVGLVPGNQGLVPGDQGLAPGIGTTPWEPTLPWDDPLYAGHHNGLMPPLIPGDDMGLMPTRPWDDPLYGGHHGGLMPPWESPGYPGGITPPFAPGGLDPIQIDFPGDRPLDDLDRYLEERAEETVEGVPREPVEWDDWEDVLERYTRELWGDLFDHTGQAEVPGMGVPGMHPMTDYTQYLSDVLMPEVIGRIGEASPWDVRRDEILEGPSAAIEHYYDQAVENLLNQAGVTGSLGMPLFRGNLTDLERDRMLAQLDVRSQFGQQAAASEEAMRSGRIGDVLAAMQADIARQESHFGQDLMARRQAIQEYNDWYDRYVSGFMLPYNYQDRGLELLLGGMGHTVQPGQAIGGAVGGAGQAGGIYNQLLQNLLGIF